MKKATQIVLLVAGIFAIIAAVGYFFASIVYFACGGFMVALDAGSINISDFPQWAIDLIDKSGLIKILNKVDTKSPF